MRKGHYETVGTRQGGKFSTALLAAGIEVATVVKGKVCFDSPLGKCVKFEPDDLRELADFIEEYYSGKERKDDV